MVTWKAEFIEQIIYAPKGSPQKKFSGSFDLFSFEENKEIIQPLIDTLRSLSKGWLQLQINWTQKKHYEFLYIKDEGD